MNNQNTSRRQFLAQFGLSTIALASSGMLSHCATVSPRRPNILFAISDDQTWLHASAYGCKAINTPAFDRVAKEGALFNNAFVVAPQCSPNRASILTGRFIWQLEEAGCHASYFPKKFIVYTDLLAQAGYNVGFTGKPWGPGNWKDAGWSQNPAGKEWNQINCKEKPPEGIRPTDYAANFEAFLNSRSTGQPFCFWYGGSEPHRKYQKGRGVALGKHIEDVDVPPFLPDDPDIRSDVLDYFAEIEWFDSHLNRMLAMLDQRGELDNTLVVVTSDNGMPFPRAKANLYEYGVHMPLAIRWPRVVEAGRVVDDLISFVDYAPTFLEAAGLHVPGDMSGKSFLNVLKANGSGAIDPERNYVLTGRERHTHARPDNLCYPSRSIRNTEYLYIWNMKPDRWPAGDPTGSGEPEGYHDIDGCPSKTFLIEHQDDPAVKKYFELAVAKRPDEELYNIVHDPGCLINLAKHKEYQALKHEMRTRLESLLKEQGDPRVLGNGDIFESYPRMSRMRNFPGFKERGKYNPKYQKKIK